MALIFRLAGEPDRDALVRFWCEHAGWDVIDRRVWEQRFVETPLGPASVVIAVRAQTEEIVGQFIFFPLKAVVEGKVLPAYRPFAPVINTGAFKEGEVNNFQDVLAGMYLHATQVLSAAGVALILMVPDPRWARIFQIFPGFQTASFPLYSRAFSGEQPVPALSAGYALEEIGRDDPGIDLLWDQARNLYPCMITRDRGTLHWKNSHRGYRYTGVTFGGRLVGLFVSLIKAAEKQWLLCDLLAADSGASLLNTLKAAIIRGYEDHLSLAAADRAGLGKIAVLATPLMRPMLEQLGFTPDNYRFTLVVHVLNDLLPEVVAPERWYISAND